MLAKLTHHAAASSAALRKHSHLLFILPVSKALSSEWPAGDVLASLMARRRLKAGELAKSPVTGNLKDGALACWIMLDTAKPAFEQQAAIRGAMQPLLAENPAELAIVVCGDEAPRRAASRVAAYCAWVNGAVLPERKRKSVRKPLKTIHLYGARDDDEFAALRARAEGNVLCRELTVLPPNELTPELYRDRIKRLAKDCGWKREEFDYQRLKKMGAGAFCAVARGSEVRDAAIVNLKYSHADATRTVALVGKGICFDTGGHNLKPARYMYSMHEDMNGSAVVLGILLAATRMQLPVNLDCWLAISRNDISPRAYHQNEVVRALNGTTIEVMHTDAEGRMVLADTLTMAAREKPELIIDFATLTGSMHAALGDRYSGVFATSDELGAQAVAAGRKAGERICVFPQDDDYDSALDSKIADVKQCTLDSDPDHILATRFLKRFVGAVPWLHMDLSASSSKSGLAAVASETTGFGVGWALDLLTNRVT
ncbi:MAG: Leucyl aminopeptidase [Betaproteobacteria bacterium]|nr:Leucyl aminopeptidase [Betaproteobacteria bacterium]